MEYSDKLTLWNYKTFSLKRAFPFEIKYRVKYYHLFVFIYKRAERHFSFFNKKLFVS